MGIPRPRKLPGLKVARPTLRERSYTEDGKLLSVRVVTVRTGTKAERKLFKDYCHKQGIEVSGELSGRDSTTFTVRGSLAALEGLLDLRHTRQIPGSSAIETVHLVVSCEHATSARFGVVGVGSGSDVALPAKRRSAIRERVKVVGVVPNRRETVRAHFLRTVYGTMAAPTVQEVPAGFVPFLLTDDDKWTFFVEAHLEHVRTLRDAALDECDEQGIDRWTRAEIAIMDYKAPAALKSTFIPSTSNVEPTNPYTFGQANKGTTFVGSFPSVERDACSVKSDYATVALRLDVAMMPDWIGGEGI